MIVTDPPIYRDDPANPAVVHDIFQCISDGAAALLLTENCYAPEMLPANIRLLSDIALSCEQYRWEARRPF
jgi:hypothetical protein